MKVLLTGATGYLGSHVARALLEAGHEVAAMMRDPAGTSRLRSLGLEPREGDMERPATWDAALGGAEALVHCAAKVSSWSRDQDAYTRVNVAGTLGLVERARAVGVSRIVVTSSLFALGPTLVGDVADESAADRPIAFRSILNAYARTKAQAAAKLRALQREGHPVMIVYPTVLLGPGPRTQGNHTAKVLADVGAGRLPGLIGDGEQVWNLVPVEDAARGHALALARGRPGEGYILGGEDWTQRRLVEEAARQFGVTPPTRRLGRLLPMAVGRTAELWAGISGREPLLTRGEVQLYDACWAFASEKARRDLGFAAGPVEAAIARTVTWLRETAHSE